MRKTFYALFIILCTAGMAHAAPGDTTWVNANNVQLDYFNNFDTTVIFPNATKTYRKIYMIFTLGKYACPGTPVYCGDWDYTVQSYFMAKHAPDTVELGRFMTPYAHTGYGRFTSTWTNRYIFDVTDYYPALKDTGTVRIHYSGYSGGFTGNIKFAFIEGTPERNVLRIDRLWHGDFNYGHGTPINTALAPLARTAPSGAWSTELKMNITGHGGDDQGCAEFCPNTYTVAMNGSTFAQQPIFRDNCSANDLYLQSGTWVYARANWCPGALVNTFTHKAPITALNNGAPAYPYTLSMSFPAYTSTTNSPNTFAASYTIDASMLYYGNYNKALDASLEDIIAPTDAEYHWRENPTTGSPRFMLRNTGSTTITSIKFEYGVKDRLPQTYTWTGNLTALQNMDIPMPPLAQLRIGAGTYGFYAKILQVNGVADEDATNNMQTSTFTAAPAWPADIRVQLRSNNEALPGGSVGQTSWRVEDIAGNVIKRKADCPLNTTCEDTVHLLAGNAYRLVVLDSSLFGYYDIASATNVGAVTGTGLAGFSSANGYLRIYDLDGGFPVTMPGYFGGNFGHGYTQYFYVGSPAAVPQTAAANAILRVFPNPAKSDVSVLVDGLPYTGGEITVVDMYGRKVLQQTYSSGIVSLSVASLPDGIYQVVYTSAKGNGLRLESRLLLAR